MPLEPPPTRYAPLGDVSIAYQVFGDGPLQVLMIPNWVTHLEAMWEIPGIARTMERLGSFARVIVYDLLGTGMSDPVSLDRVPTMEDRSAEVRAVLDAANAGPVGLIGYYMGGPIAMLAAATLPDRFNALALLNTSARWQRDEDYSIGAPPEVFDGFTETLVRFWGNPTPSGFGPDLQRERWARYQRMAASPNLVRAMTPVAIGADVRGVLGAIRIPTLVASSLMTLKPDSPGIGARVNMVEHGRFLADRIEGARFLELLNPEPEMPPALDLFLDDVEEFFTGKPHTPVTDRVLATVLFSDIVGSTETAARLGDARWKALLDAHDDMVRRQLARFQGREVVTTGDGFLLVFDGPARAIRCAEAIREGARRIDLEVRMGVHTGEVELRGVDVAGIAVHIAARVAAKAGPSEILVSRTVCDLVVGSGLQFEDRGEHVLKGVPGEWRLFALAE
ncbi:MAG: adenylate/guanylate cyclase domain-containing protein [Actinomycetota bacterium]